ncbi:holin [Exiguobacterium phage vB_EalM-132]|nr:holin [Exiguobacterium phage vB_EalM-132]
MEAIVNMATSLAIEIVILIGGTLTAVVLSKLKSRLEVLKKADELGIVDLVTDRIVELVEVEFKGVKGTEKRDIAINRVIKILAEKGIHVSETEIRAGIENGVNKLHVQGGRLIESGVFTEEPEVSFLVKKTSDLEG